MAESLEPTAWLRGHRASVSCLAFTRDNNYLVSGDSDGDLLVWNLQSKRVVKQLLGEHEGGVLQICVNLEEYGTIWMSQGRMDGSLKIWNAQTHELINLLRLETESFCKCFAMFFGEASNFMLACTKPRDANTAVIWDSRAQLRQPVREFHALCTSFDGTEHTKTGMVMAVELIRARQEEAAVPLHLAAAYEDGFVRIFHVESAAQVYCVCVQADFQPATTFTFCYGDKAAAEGKGVAAGASSQMTVFYFNPDENKPARSKSVPVLATASREEKLGRGVSQIALRRDARICAVASWDHRVRIFHWQTMKPLAVLKSHRDSVQCVAFSPNSRLLASGSKDRNIAIWTIF